MKFKNLSLLLGVCGSVACCSTETLSNASKPIKSSVTCRSFDPPAVIACASPLSEDEGPSVLKAKAVKVCVDSHTGFWDIHAPMGAVMVVEGRSCRLMQIDMSGVSQSALDALKRQTVEQIPDDSQTKKGL